MNEELSKQPILEGKKRPISKYYLVIFALMLAAFVALFIQQKFFS